MQDEEPEAYRLGWIPWNGLEIHLDSKPLIPRPETEWWTEEMIGEVRRRQNQKSSRSGPLGQVLLTFPAPSAPTSLRLLDLCSGSGAIGCTFLKELPTAHVSFGEIDPAHEATIRKNIEINKLDASRADVRIGDLFAPFAGEQFDYIAANPPYIPDARELPASVADYEPALALRAGEDGLALIRRIAEDLPKYLKPGGEAWIECDSAHADSARDLFIAQGMRAEVRLDQYKVSRLIVIS